MRRASVQTSLVDDEEAARARLWRALTQYRDALERAEAEGRAVADAMAHYARVIRSREEAAPTQSESVTSLTDSSGMG